MIIINNSSSSSDTEKGAKDVTSLIPVPSVCLIFFDVAFAFLNSDQHKPPPSYLDSTETSSTISSTSISTLGTDRLPTIPNIQPSNYIHLSRANESIKGSWLIDPSLSIPQYFLPSPTSTGAARSNLFLGSKNGGIDADVFLLPTSHSNNNTSKIIDIQTESNNGSVKTRLVSLIVCCPSVRAGIH